MCGSRFQNSGNAPDEQPTERSHLAVICAETQEEARHVAGTAAWRKMMAGRGAKEPLLSPEEVEQRRRQLSPGDQAELDATRDAMVVGTPEQCWEQFHAFARDYQLDELGLVTVTHSFADRINSYRLLAEAR
ncbi:LLM class flavin-dependent oxidoreductase [Pseudomonas sp. GCM10022188]|uniref:LLM class flavin-dependent oxidoreductase n=1 Tax=Pseudomonas TaxID=286 RepID=UPI00222857E8|nr:LLM class flavin-dependent oxidoreductase [Pseudomonas oryzagri]MCC6076882.1 LLM class flavin-dependent oxidoreductase [Pseudomonas oryzagri]